MSFVAGLLESEFWLKVKLSLYQPQWKAELLAQTSGICEGSFQQEVVMAKTNCPITRAEFSEKAKAVPVVIGETKLLADVKEFSTGSLGWYLNGKVSIEIDGKPVMVQVGLNLTIVGSKELPKA
jgi:hypothetical protein